MSELDNELYQLCKEVYERYPEWYSDAHRLSFTDRFGKGNYRLMQGRNGTSVPLYTSDYLLGKLPIHLGDPLGISDYLRVEPLTKGKWAACYGNNKSFDEWSGTPLKALLKLTIALDQAGELNKLKETK